MLALRSKYTILISIVGVYFLVELIVGLIADSITLQTDAFHMLSDLLALCIGLAALSVLDRKHHRYTYGWVRAEIIAGLINSVFLLSIGFMLIIENIQKFIELAEEESNDKLEDNIDVVLIVAGIGLAINIVGVGLFCNEHSHGHAHSHGHSHDEEDEVIRNYAQAAVLLHIIGDALGSVMVLISGVVIKYVDQSWKFYLDPVGSLLIIIFITASSSRLLWECVKILMLRWAGTAADDIISELCAIDGVDDIHEFHVWPLDNKVTVASLHVKINQKVRVKNLNGILEKCKTILHSHSIHSSTIQPEWSSSCTEPVCDRDCTERKCCKKIHA